MLINPGTDGTFPEQSAHHLLEERDEESNLDNFEVRYMGSSLGRFMSPDPIFFQASMLSDPQLWNEYAYVRNNPLILIDPTGEAAELTGDAEERQKQLDALRSEVGRVAHPKPHS
jgi:RHS repeat-associated protein